MKVDQKQAKRKAEEIADRKMKLISPATNPLNYRDTDQWRRMFALEFRRFTSPAG